MKTTQTPYHIHPLMAAAAVSVTLVSLLGMAAITGILPISHGTAVDTAHLTAQSAAVVPAPKAQATPTPVVVGKVHHHRPAPVRVVAAPVRDYSPAPTYQRVQQSQQQTPVAHNSPVGIGIGAVVGGLLGNQVGGGNGRTLATIAGVVGGGYMGNEIAKRNQ